MRLFRSGRALAALLLIAGVSEARAAEAPDQALFREIYQELVEINTTQATGDSAQAAEAMGARLKAAGFPAEDVQVLVSGRKKGNLVARLRGTGAKKPMLLLAHLDVVEAKRADWEFDPFKLQEVDGYFRGRGTIDDKSMAAIFTANMIRYWKEGLKPERDLILALTADEEIGGGLGVGWLLKNHRALLEAEFALNEGGGGVLQDGKPMRNTVQLAEKMSVTFRLEVTDPGGHSSLPRRENPIYTLAEGLTRIAKYEFPPRLNAVTRAYFERVAATEKPETAAAIKALLDGRTQGETLAPLAESVLYNAQIRTTCVATMLEGGHAVNALPQTARAVVNCRMMPEESDADLLATLVKVLAEPKIAVTPLNEASPSPPSPLAPEIIVAIEQLTAEMWPGVPVIPTMSTGATDSKFLRNIGIPAYGVSGLFSEPGKNGVHGLNEQVAVKSLYDSKEFLYRLVKTLAAKG
jgi:acetylornithine deacetylase/succinyl-diaminopimelate desuccinylase-like protein